MTYMYTHTYTLNLRRSPLRRIPGNTVRSATCWRVAMGEASACWAMGRPMERNPVFDPLHSSHSTSLPLYRNGRQKWRRLSLSQRLGSWWSTGQWVRYQQAYGSQITWLCVIKASMGFYGDFCRQLNFGQNDRHAYLLHTVIENNDFWRFHCRTSNPRNGFWIFSVRPVYWAVPATTSSLQLDFKLS